MRRQLSLWIMNFFSIGDPEWAWRRRAALASILVAFFLIFYAVLKEPKDERFNKMLDTAWLIISSVMTIYVGGAVVDTMNKRRYDSSGGQISGNPGYTPTPASSFLTPTTPTTGPAGGLAGPQAVPQGSRPIPPTPMGP